MRWRLLSFSLHQTLLSLWITTAHAQLHWTWIVLWNSELLLLLLTIVDDDVAKTHKITNFSPNLIIAVLVTFKMWLFWIFAILLNYFMGGWNSWFNIYCQIFLMLADADYFSWCCCCFYYYFIQNTSSKAIRIGTGVTVKRIEKIKNQWIRIRLHLCAEYSNLGRSFFCVYAVPIHRKTKTSLTVAIKNSFRNTINNNFFYAVHRGRINAPKKTVRKQV